MRVHTLMPSSFAEYAAEKTRAAAAAVIPPLRTLEAAAAESTIDGVGNEWTAGRYDGLFRIFPVPRERPAVSAVFVQSREGNTGADDPGALGGGPTDLHLIYEGLSRVSVDGVLAGAATASGERTFFSLWHPELVALRGELGLPRHPAQIVVSATGRLDVEGTLLFNVPAVPVFVLAGSDCLRRCGGAFAARRWITVVPLEADGITGALGRLRTVHGIERVSAIGGRTTATQLFDAGVVQDLCLTTTARAAGEPGTPFYTGSRPPAFEPLVRKVGADPEAPILFEHLVTR